MPNCIAIDEAKGLVTLAARRLDEDVEYIENVEVAQNCEIQYNINKPWPLVDASFRLITKDDGLWHLQRFDEGVVGGGCGGSSSEDGYTEMGVTFSAEEPACGSPKPIDPKAIRSELANFCDIRLDDIDIFVDLSGIGRKESGCYADSEKIARYIANQVRNCTGLLSASYGIEDILAGLTDPYRLQIIYSPSVFYPMNYADPFTRTITILKMLKQHEMEEGSIPDSSILESNQCLEPSLAHEIIHILMAGSPLEDTFLGEGFAEKIEQDIAHVALPITMPTYEGDLKVQEAAVTAPADEFAAALGFGHSVQVADIDSDSASLILRDYYYERMGAGWTEVKREVEAPFGYCVESFSLFYCVYPSQEEGSVHIKAYRNLQQNLVECTEDGAQMAKELRNENGDIVSKKEPDKISTYENLPGLPPCSAGTIEEGKWDEWDQLGAYSLYSCFWRGIEDDAGPDALLAVEDILDERRRTQPTYMPFDLFGAVLGATGLDENYLRDVFLRKHVPFTINDTCYKLVDGLGQCWPYWAD